MRTDKISSGTKANYTAFIDDNFFVDKNGVSRYWSDAIRRLPGNNHYPSKDGTAITCNNMINYQVDACDSVHG